MNTPSNDTNHHVDQIYLLLVDQIDQMSNPWGGSMMFLEPKSAKE